MSEEVSKPEKPVGVPRYYSLRGIKAAKGHDWEYDSTQNSWVWRATPAESSQFEEAETTFATRFTPKAAERDDYGIIRLNGEPKTVWQDSQGKEWVEDYNTHTRHYLREGWWRDPAMRGDASKAITESKVTEFETRESYWEKIGWKPTMPKMPSLPSFPKMSSEGIAVKLPDIGAGAKMGLTIGVLFIAGIVVLIALGYSGMGGSVGRVGEREYSRKRK